MADDEIELSGPNSPQQVAKVGGPAEASSVPAAAAVTGLHDDAAIAEALTAGRIDAATAQALLIEQIVAEQLPADASPEQIERLRGELGGLLAGDPTLAGLLSG